MARAGGDQSPGQGPQLLLPGAQGNSTLLLPQPSPTSDPSGGSGPSPVAGYGEAPGKEHDPNLLSDPTALRARHEEHLLTGQQGAGPSRSETILGAAQKGFATTAYRRVYGDYSAVTEEVLSKEQVPPGYRYYVKRYFQLIKPRE
jgi:hypothetical protein